MTSEEKRRLIFQANMLYILGMAVERERNALKYLAERGQD
jgi:hypothetical protein